MSTKQLVVTSQFKKDFKKAQKQGKKTTIVASLMTLILEGKPLDKKWKDHPLKGNFKGCRECHLEPDWLLIYKSEKEKVVFHRLGSHSDLFKK